MIRPPPRSTPSPPPPLSGSWVVTVTWVAAPAVIVMVVDGAPVSPVAEKLSVRSPAVPVMDKLVKRAEERPVGEEGRAPRPHPPYKKNAPLTTNPGRATARPRPPPRARPRCDAPGLPQGVAPHVSQMHHWLLGDRHATRRRRRGLGRSRQLGRGPGGDRDGGGRDAREPRRREAQRPVPRRAGDGQVGEARYAGPGRGCGERADRKSVV